MRRSERHPEYLVGWSRGVVSPGGTSISRNTHQFFLCAWRVVPSVVQKSAFFVIGTSPRRRLPVQRGLFERPDRIPPGRRTQVFPAGSRRGRAGSTPKLLSHLVRISSGCSWHHHLPRLQGTDGLVLRLLDLEALGWRMAGMASSDPSAITRMLSRSRALSRSSRRRASQAACRFNCPW